jgi:DNA-binding response OmpR family regulator
LSVRFLDFLIRTRRGKHDRQASLAGLAADIRAYTTTINARIARLKNGDTSGEMSAILARVEEQLEKLAALSACLPHPEADSPSPEKDEQRVTTKERSRTRVLAVEPDDRLRDYLVSLLSRKYDTVALPCSREVMERIAEIDPDIVITEVAMEWMRGDELCNTLKSNVETNHISVILLSALSDRESVIRGLESGADDYIAKPFDAEILLTRIHNVLANRVKLREAVSSGIAMKGEIAWTEVLDREFMDKTVAIVESKMSDVDFSVNRLCVEMRMSRSSFYSKIKSLTGQAPADFIRTIRLARARELLLQGRHNVTEVADIVGFSDAKHFSTSFKKQFGMSPSKLKVN